MEEEEKPTTTLRDEMKQLSKEYKAMVEKKEQKKFNIPFKSRVNKNKVKNGYVTICYIHDNRGIEFLKAPIKEGIIMVNDQPHIATTNYMLSFKNKPFLIVPSWNTIPFAPSQNLSEAQQKETLTVGYKLILNRLRSEQLKDKMKISAGWVIGILIVLVGGYYLLNQGGLI